MKNNSPLQWIKNNKLTALLIVAVIYLLTRSNSPMPFLGQPKFLSTPAIYDSLEGDYSANYGETAPSAKYSAQRNASAPVSNENERMVSTDTSLSLKVDSVNQAMSQITQLTSQHDGYMVNQNINQPEEGANGWISVRVKSDQLSDFLESVRGVAIKVVSEQVSGRDITDQYTNIEERLRVLNNTKTRFEELLQSAVAISDMLEAQRELLNLQTQIDNLEGQRRYLKESAEYSLVSIHLATDEMGLPYAPSASWRPKLVFKQAVRSLVSTSRNLGSLTIWAAVYSPLWLLVLGVVLIVRKRGKRRKDV